jgi:outer membrane protein OmpA-like peptidoglycan-associated protein
MSLNRYFHNFDSFIFEKNANKLIAKAKKLEAEAEFMKSKGKEKKAERLLKKAAELKKEAETLNSGDNTGDNDNVQNITDDVVTTNDENENNDEEQKLSDNYASSAIDGINELVTLLSNEIFKGKTLEIIGFTSTTGSDSYNKSLSLRRSRIVINSIKDLMDQKKIENYNDITFKVQGYGEEKDRLIVVNDTSLDTIQVGSNYDAENVKKKIEEVGDSKETRQELNRRVEVSLPNIKPKYKVKTKLEEKPEKEKEVEKPLPPNPTEIEFNFNSYILREDSKNILQKFAKAVKTWNDQSEDDKIENIYMSAHTFVPRKKTDTNKEFHFILSANRASMVRRFLESQKIDVEMEIAPVGYEIPNDDGDDKRVEIRFEEDDTIKAAKVKFAELAGEFNASEVEGYYDNEANDVMKNSPLRKICLKNVEARREQKVIPPELWNDDLGQLEKDLDRFKNRVRKRTNLNDDEIEETYVFERQ